MKKFIQKFPGSVVAAKRLSGPAGVFLRHQKIGTGKGSNKGQKRDSRSSFPKRPRPSRNVHDKQIGAAPVKVCVERVKGGWLKSWW